jgi:predicted PurR-regulated permease PerM
MDMNPPFPSRDIPRITRTVPFIGLLIVASLWVLWPFIAATIWAPTVVVATWPMMLALQARLGGRRWLAVTAMTGAMLLLVVPLVLAVSTIIDYADDIGEWAKATVAAGVPSPPEWVGRIPWSGRSSCGNGCDCRRPARRLAVQAAPHVRGGRRGSPATPATSACCSCISC